MRAWAALTALVAAACTVERSYLIDPATGAQLVQPGAPAASIPAVRERDHVAVRLDPSAISASVVRGARVVARGRSRLVAAGIPLTFVGTAVSLVGTALFFAVPSGGVHTLGLALTPSAEPLMIAGTVLWIVGLNRPPFETR